jgi:hypothetical protein
LAIILTRIRTATPARMCSMAIMAVFSSRESLIPALFRNRSRVGTGGKKCLLPVQCTYKKVGYQFIWVF